MEPQTLLQSDPQSPTPVGDSPEEGLSALGKDGSSGPPPKDPAVHKRNYQACVPCRNRKVKCDLGSVDSPDEPPCKRCKREKKECWFTDERRRPKTEEEGSQEPPSGIGGAHARKRSSMSAGQAVRPLSFQDRVEASRLMQEQLKTDAKERLTRAVPSDPNSRIVSDDTTRRQLSTPVTNQHQAMNLLVQAAFDGDATRAPRATDAGDTNSLSAIRADPNAAESLKAWRNTRFVRTGTFTVAEGIKYVQYYFHEMAPLTPVSIPDYSDVRTHADLLLNEPVLAATILTITSRYMILAGPSATTRGFKIHEQMWSYLQGTITRMFWGQDQLGSGFSAANGDMTTVEGVQARRRGLRSLGAAESLLLLSDWLPRSMHFNPLDNCGELVASDNDSGHDTSGNDDPRAAWIEPSQRSDRMCWSLVSMAHTLVVELGVYDSFLETRHWNPGPQPKTAYANQRAGRLGRMVYIYLTQTCGRLVFPNTLPEPADDASSNFLKMDVPQDTYPSPYGLITEADKVQRAWAELTLLIRKSNEAMFDSQERTSQATRDGSYKTFIQHFGEELRMWREKLDSSLLDATAKTVVLIEYQHARMFVYSLALQAVLDKMSDDRNEQSSSSALFSDAVKDTYKANWVDIQQVIESSRDILDMAVDSLDGNVLRHAPVRTFFRILAAAVFLLKTVALGGKESEITKSLNRLKSTVDALRSSAVDDVHLALRIADLLGELLTATHAKLRVIKIGGRKSAKAGTTQSTAADVKPSTTGPADHAEIAGLDPERLYANLPFDRPPEANLSDPNITLMGPIDFSTLNPETTYPRPATRSQAPPSMAPSGMPVSSTHAGPFGHLSMPQLGSGYAPTSISGTVPGVAPLPLAPDGVSDNQFWAAADFNDVFGESAARASEAPTLEGPGFPDFFADGRTIADCNPLGPYVARDLDFLGAFSGWTNASAYAPRGNPSRSPSYHPGNGLARPGEDDVGNGQS